MNLIPYKFHIESLNRNSYESLLNNNNFISGHVTYTHINKIVDLNEWVTVATFREPVDYTISHLKWVRKLADEGEEKRFNEHPPIFQRIAKEMLKYDFSIPLDIIKFISWIESIGFGYFHNTQTLYMNSDRNDFAPTYQQMQVALENIDKIDFVGIQDELDGFMGLLRYEMGWVFNKDPKININENDYGFDKTDKATIEALRPLYEKDMILYNHAKEKYKELLRSYSKTDEHCEIICSIDEYSSNRIRGWARYSDNLNKVEFEILSGRNVIGSFIANDFRADLKRKKIHPSGRCGFKIDLSHYSNIPNLQVQFKHNKKIISKN